MSAPSSSGRVRSGVGTVLSTTEEGAGGVRHGGDRLDVARDPGRVRRGLEPDEAQIRCPGGGIDGGEVGHVDEIEREGADSSLRHQPFAQAPVITLGATTPAAGRDGSDRHGRGRHAGGEQQRLAAILGGPEHPLGRDDVRIAIPAIVEATTIGVVGIANEGGARLDRRHDATRRLVDGVGGLRQQGGFSQPRLGRARHGRIIPLAFQGLIAGDGRRRERGAGLEGRGCDEVRSGL